MECDDSTLPRTGMCPSYWLCVQSGLKSYIHNICFISLSHHQADSISVLHPAHGPILFVLHPSSSLRHLCPCDPAEQLVLKHRVSPWSLLREQCRPAHTQFTQQNFHSPNLVMHGSTFAHVITHPKWCDHKPFSLDPRTRKDKVLPVLASSNSMSVIGQEKPPLSILEEDFSFVMNITVFLENSRN